MSCYLTPHDSSRKKQQFAATFRKSDEASLRKFTRFVKTTEIPTKEKREKEKKGMTHPTTAPIRSRPPLSIWGAHVEGTIKSVGRADAQVVVKTGDGTEETFHGAERATLDCGEGIARGSRFIAKHLLALQPAQ